MSRGRRHVLAVLLSVGAASACAGGMPPADTSPFTPSGPQDVLLTVQNNDARAAVIYAYWNGLKERIGTVSGAKTETFTMEWRYELVELAYEFIGRRALPGQDYVDGFRSRPIDVYRGDHLDLVIQPQG